MSQYFGGSEDRKETPGKRPLASLPAAARPGLFGAASPGKAFPSSHPAGGRFNPFGDSAASPPDNKALPTSGAQFSMFGDASTSDNLGRSSDQAAAAANSVLAESPGGDPKPFPRASDVFSGTTAAFSPPTDTFTHERRTANSAFSALATQQPAFRHFRR